MTEKTPVEKLHDLLLLVTTAAVPVISDPDPLNAELLKPIGSIARGINRYFCAENRIRIKRAGHV